MSVIKEMLLACLVFFALILVGTSLYSSLKSAESPVVVERLVYPESMSCPVDTRPEREHFILLCIDNAPETLEAMRLCISTAKADYCDVDKMEL
jgi:hypothetical protein